jgi:heme oxygenase
MSYTIFKKETKELHARLDQSGLLKKIMTNNVKIEDYLDFLLFHKVANELLENTMLKAYSSLDWRSSDRLEKLNIDINYILNKLSLPSKNITLEDTIQHEVKPSLGLIYVMEGARHGNRYIYQHLKTKLNLGDEAFQFLAMDASIKWSDVQSQLDRLGDAEISFHLNQAKKTFELLIKISTILKEKTNEKHQI